MSSAPRNGGFTLAEVLAAVMVVLVVVVLLFPAMTRSRRHHRILTCADHLKTLYKAQADHRAANPKARPEIGQAFWLQLARTTPPRVTLETLRCPLAEYPQSPECHYLGPAADAATLKPADFLGCDLDHNHGMNGKQGGNILFASGQVDLDDGDRWRDATRGGKCRP